MENIKEISKGDVFFKPNLYYTHMDMCCVKDITEESFRGRPSIKVVVSVGGYNTEKMTINAVKRCMYKYYPGMIHFTHFEMPEECFKGCINNNRQLMEKYESEIEYMMDSEYDEQIYAYSPILPEVNVSITLNKKGNIFQIDPHVYDNDGGYADISPLYFDDKSYALQAFDILVHYQWSLLYVI